MHAPSASRQIQKRWESGSRGETAPTNHSSSSPADMTGPSPGAGFSLVRGPLSRGGCSGSDAVFTVDRDGRGSVGVLGKVAGAKAVLVTDEPRGGSTVPTRRPVVSGRLS